MTNANDIAAAFLAIVPAARRERAEEALMAAFAAEKAKLSLRGKKAAAQRKLNAAASRLHFNAFNKLTQMMEMGQFDEVMETLSTK